MTLRHSIHVPVSQIFYFFKMLGQEWERNSLSPFQQNARNREIREAMLLATLKTQSEPMLFPNFSECACISGERL